MLAGTGLKIKTVEALGFGMPIVTTTAGASGLGHEHGNSLRIAEDSYSFVNQLTALLPSITELATLSKNALAFADAWNRQTRIAWAGAL
jgi:hypothetical protein